MKILFLVENSCEVVVIYTQKMGVRRRAVKFEKHLKNLMFHTQAFSAESQQ